MAYLRKKLERRTYSQDRYYILIKRQKSGKATFNELTELDEIVNRVPDIREKVIRESFMIDDVQDADTPPNDTENNSSLLQQSRKHPTFWHRIRSFITRVFSSHIIGIKAGDMAVLS
ncbi:MAG: hypothetical protein ACXVB0_20350 [Mucilaginibacter sp.]